MLISDLGKIGIIKDVSPYNLPPNAFSGGRNVRFYENSVEKFLGHKSALEASSGGGPVVSPYWSTSLISGTDAMVVYAGSSKIYSTDGVVHYDITRLGGDYAMDTNKGWTGGVMGGVVFMNNGVDAPQSWVSPAVLATRLTDLPNWPASAKCGSLRSFKQFMIAMDYTNGSGTNYPRLIKWSTGASFNTVPTSWDETDATLDAGEYELADTPGRVVDGSELRDAFMIYKEDSIWGMQHVGPPFVFRFYKISESTGGLNRRCMSEFPNGHFVFGINDCFINDGQNLTSVLDQRMRREVFDGLNIGNYNKCFVTPYYPRSEMWACYPSQNNTWCDKAVVWNWKDNSISVKDLPDLAFISSGVAPTVMAGGDSPTWQGGTDWDTNIGPWDDAPTSDQTKTELLMSQPGVSGSAGDLFVAESTNQEAGVDMTANVVRESLFYDSIDTVKFCKGVRISAQGDPFNVYVGRQMSPSETTTWEGPFEFDPSTDYKIDCRVSGRLLGVKFESTTDVAWKITSYDMDIIPSGRN